MGEYVKYKGRDVKIGTRESLYYVSYRKFTAELELGQLSRAEFNADPSVYSKAGAGFLFRFPFPDEDQTRFGEVKDFNRGVPITLTDPAVLEEFDYDQSRPYRKDIQLEFQKRVLRESDGKDCLAIVLRNGKPPFSELFRLEDDRDVLNIVGQLTVNNIARETDPEQRQFYAAIAQRIVDGYGLKLPLAVEQAMKKAATAEQIKPVTLKNKKRMRL
jgi:hypothetical protein